MLTPELVHLAGVLGSVLLLIGGVIWWFLKRHLSKLHREIKAYKERNAKLKEKEAEITELLAKLASVLERLERLEASRK